MVVLFYSCQASRTQTPASPMSQTLCTLPSGCTLAASWAEEQQAGESASQRLNLQASAGELPVPAAPRLQQKVPLGMGARGPLARSPGRGRSSRVRAAPHILRHLLLPAPGAMRTAAACRHPAPGSFSAPAAPAPAEQIGPDDARSILKYTFPKKPHERGNKSRHRFVRSLIYASVHSVDYF